MKLKSYKIFLGENDMEKNKSKKKFDGQETKDILAECELIGSALKEAWGEERYNAAFKKYEEKYEKE